MKFIMLTKSFLVIFILFGCRSAPGSNRTPEIIRTDYQYEKILFGNHRFTFEFHLENIGNAMKINDLINNLMYKNRNFDEYVAYMESEFIGDANEADYPPMIDEDGTEYFYHSDLIEKYFIIYHDDAYIVFEYNLYFYNSGAAHGNYWIGYFIIDILEERILDISDVVNPIPDDLLKGIIELLTRQ